MVFSLLPSARLCHVSELLLLATIVSASVWASRGACGYQRLLWSCGQSKLLALSFCHLSCRRSFFFLIVVYRSFPNLLHSCGYNAFDVFCVPFLDCCCCRKYPSGVCITYFCCWRRSLGGFDHTGYGFSPFSLVEGCPEVLQTF